MSRYARQLARGVRANLVGLAGKLIHPVFILLVTWMYGPDTMGLYFLTLIVAQIVGSAVASGYHDATLIFGAHVADEDAAEGKLYQVLANGFGISGVLAVTAMLAGWFGADLLVAHVFTDKPSLVPALRIAACVIPAAAFVDIGLAATKARMHMEYDAAFNGYLRPLVSLAFATLAWWVDGSLAALMLAHLAAELCLAAGVLWALTRHFDLRRLLRAIRTLRPDRRMLRFAVPQSLNVTLIRYLVRLDVLMLGAFAYDDAMLAFYATGALITYNMREIQLIFSHALVPVAARHHALGERDELSATLSRLTRWATTIVVPLLLGLLVLRDDLLRFVDASYVHDTTFMAVLLVPPLLTCAVGLMGNTVVYTGHSTVNLLNTLVVATLNTVLNLWLIPSHGLLGAAVATALSMTIVSVLQVVELYFMEGIRLRLSAVWKPYVGLFAGLGLLLALWDPARLGGLGTRLVLAASLVVGFVALMALLRHEELRLSTIRSWLTR